MYDLLQFEVFVQFFIGVYDSSEKYCDNPFLIASRYLTSPRCFSFDFVTSLPWSYIDLNSYQVYSGFLTVFFKYVIYPVVCFVFSVISPP